jgi:hypothetical protein
MSNLACALNQVQCPNTTTNTNQMMCMDKGPNVILTNDNNSCCVTGYKLCGDPSQTPPYKCIKAGPEVLMNKCTAFCPDNKKINGDGVNTSYSCSDPQATNPNPSQPNSSSSLSQGAVAGIICAIVFVILCIVIGFWIWFRASRKIRGGGIYETIENFTYLVKPFVQQLT